MEARLKESLWRKAYDLYLATGKTDREELFAAALELARDTDVPKEMLRSYIDEIILTTNRMKARHAINSIDAEAVVDMAMEGSQFRYSVKCGAKWPEVTVDIGHDLAATFQLNYKNIYEGASALQETSRALAYMAGKFRGGLEVDTAPPWIEWKTHEVK